LIVVWGPEADTVTAFEEVHKRLVDALDGVPHETRQPFADGHTDFERILPGPDRMYPDTDSPPTAIARDRVEALRRKLPPVPWDREKRYAAAGLPRPTIHYLIRRGGAELVDLVAQSLGEGSLRRAGFFFGERLKALQRAGIDVGAISPKRWVELFALLEERPAARDIAGDLVSAMAAAPDRTAAECFATLRPQPPPPDWERRARELARAAHRRCAGKPRAAGWRSGMGAVLRTLRGIVPAREIAEVVERAVGAGEGEAASALEMEA